MNKDNNDVNWLKHAENFKNVYMVDWNQVILGLGEKKYIWVGSL